MEKLRCTMTPERRSEVARKRAISMGPERLKAAMAKRAVTMGSGRLQAVRAKQIETLGPERMSEVARKRAQNMGVEKLKEVAQKGLQVTRGRQGRTIPIGVGKHGNLWRARTRMSEYGETLFVGSHFKTWQEAAAALEAYRIKHPPGSVSHGAIAPVPQQLALPGMR